jgi:hypothetical protein
MVHREADIAQKGDESAVASGLTKRRGYRAMINTALSMAVVPIP